MSQKVKIILLETLLNFDRKWTWYALDRSLVQYELGSQVFPSLTSLINDGLVMEIPSDTSSMSGYVITDKGREWLKNLSHKI